MPEPMGLLIYAWAGAGILSIVAGAFTWRQRIVDALSPQARAYNRDRARDASLLLVNGLLHWAALFVVASR